MTLKSSLDCPIGFSDHTEGTHIAFGAVCLGANIVEKHFTLDKKMNGPDQKISMSPSDLRNLVNNIRDFEKATGTGVKVPAAEEREPRIFKRRGVYARRALSTGETLTRNDVVFYAPSSETSSVEDWERMVGRRLAVPVQAMELINSGDIKFK